ncbi:MAG: glycogen/starch synthase, partial [Tumebacillaceae bacterium]
MEQTLWAQLLDVLHHSERLVVHMAAENAPFSKKGGLGDVVESLPAALKQNHIENVVISPYYSKMGGGQEPVLVHEDHIFYNGVSYSYRLYLVYRNEVYNLFVRLEEAFAFDKLYLDGLLPYRTEVDLSYFMLGKVMFHFLDKFVRAAVLITHDWHVASIYPYLREEENRFTTFHIIHNYHYQGEVYFDIMHYVEEETQASLREIFDRYGYCSLSAIALEHADQVITVSPTYAEELKRQTAPHPFLKVAKGKPIVGLLNGMHSHWNPEQDEYLVQPYTADTMELKRQNKRHLIKRLGLQIDEETPIVLLLSRLTIQKGIDLLIDMKLGPAFDIHERMRTLTDFGCAVVVCGTPQGGIGGPVDFQFQEM